MYVRDDADDDEREAVLTTAGDETEVLSATWPVHLDVQTMTHLTGSTECQRQLAAATFATTIPFIDQSSW